MVGGVIVSAFGGWNAALTALVVCMVVDYSTGIAVAIAGKSKKTEKGGLSSTVGMRGIIKKIVIMLLVLVSAQVDSVMGTHYIRDAVCIGFVLNEILSIIENAGLLGIPLPAALKNAVDLLKTKSGEKKE